MKRDKVLCFRFLFAFLPLAVLKKKKKKKKKKTLNSCFLRTEDRTNRSVLVNYELRHILILHVYRKGDLVITITQMFFWLSVYLVSILL